MWPIFFRILDLFPFYLNIMCLLPSLLLGASFVSFVLYYFLTLVIDTAIDLDKLASQYIHIVGW